MKKYLIVTMPDGSKWSVPVCVVAKHRATSLAKGGADFNTEYGLVMSRMDLVLDWSQNYMKWDDVKDRARKVKEPPVNVDYQYGWANGEKMIIRTEPSTFFK